MSKEDVLLFSTYGMRGEGKSCYEKLKEKDKEIERLNNNWNKLEEEISNHIALCTDITLNDILDLMQELKGVDKE